MFIGGSPGLVIMGRDSCSEGCGFKSRHHILDGHFFTYICCKNCNVCLKRPKINEKEAGVGPFLKNLCFIFANLVKYTVWNEVPTHLSYYYTELINWYSEVVHFEPNYSYCRHQERNVEIFGIKNVVMCRNVERERGIVREKNDIGR